MPAARAFGWFSSFFEKALVRRVNRRPLFQFVAALDGHRVARLPQVSEHMKEVEHDGQLHPVVRGQFCEEAQLRLVAVDHGNPGPGTLPVATDGFAERLLQDLPWLLLQARPHPLVLRTGTRRGLLLSLRGTPPPLSGSTARSCAFGSDRRRWRTSAPRWRRRIVTAARRVGFRPHPPRSSSSRAGARVPRLPLGTLAASRVPRLAVSPAGQAVTK